MSLRRKQRKTRSPSRPVESGTEELQKKHILKTEPLDYRGLVTRSRVIDQNEMDRMFIRREISAPQHAAAEKFLELAVVSGMFARASNPEKGVQTSMRDVEKSLSTKIMVISNAWRRLLDMAGRDASSLVIGVIVYGRRVPKVSRGSLLCGLDALVRIFKTDGVKDPRS